MLKMRIYVVCVLIVVLVSACAQKPAERRGKVHCPDCGAEVEALFEKHY